MSKAPAIRLSDWAMKSDPYKAPEQRAGYLIGTRETDGKTITTSRIVTAIGRIVTTNSGSTYKLGRIHPEYRKWLREQGIAYDARQPIRVYSRRDLGSWEEIG